MPMVWAPCFCGLVTLDEIHLRRADEAGHEAVARGAVKLKRAADLLDPAGLQHHDLVGHGHGFHLIVGHVDHRGLQALVQLGDFKAHAHAQSGIKVGQRLIKQEGRRLAHNGAPDGNALALTAGKGRRATVEIVGQIEHGGACSTRDRCSAWSILAIRSGKGDVLAHDICG
jgi:hypothetical protein